MNSARLYKSSCLARTGRSIFHAAFLSCWLTGSHWACAQIQLPSPGNINTTAGTGVQGYSGDGGQATSAKLYYPQGIALDSSGNIYFADEENNVIRRITATTGIISTVAGNGTQGYTGDGQSATQAELNQPQGVYVDSSGNIYIADSGNNVVREVSGGIINTVAGGGTPCAQKTDAYGDGCPSTQATLYGVAGIKVDSSGNIYLTDGGRGRIRAVYSSGTLMNVSNPQQGYIYVIAGGGSGCSGSTDSVGDGCVATSAVLSEPVFIMLDFSGNLYISDTYNNRVRKVNASTGIITTIAGNGTQGYAGDSGSGANAEFYHPMGLALSGVGNLYIADNANCVVRELFASTGNIYTVVGNHVCNSSANGGFATGAELHYVPGVALDNSGNLYLTDTEGDQVHTVVRQVPSLSVTWSPTLPASGQTVTFTCAATYGGQPVVNGTPLTFWLDGTNVSSATTTSGSATWTTSALTAGQHDVRCGSGDSNYDSAQMDVYPTVAVSDSGTISLMINGTTVATTNYGPGSTPESVAAGLTANNSVASVSAVGNVLYITGNPSYGSGDYVYSIVSVSNAGFNPPSFSGTPAGGDLEGGSSNGGSSQPVYSNCISSAPGSNCPSTPNGGYDAAGNVLSYYDSVMGMWSFGYDSLNRITQGTSSIGEYQGLQVAWGYDSFGNRTTENFSGTLQPNSTAPIPVSTAATYDADNHVLTAGADFPPSYDAAGDAMCDSLNANTIPSQCVGGNQYFYDAEGRICEEYTVMGGTMTGYLYDAEGNRIAKGTVQHWGSCDPAANGFETSTETDDVRGQGGEQMSELSMDANGNMAWQHTNVWIAGTLIGTYDNNGLHFYLNDWLGTRRVQTDYDLLQPALWQRRNL
jgi:hypothetical protein